MFHPIYQRCFAIAIAAGCCAVVTEFAAVMCVLSMFVQQFMAGKVQCAMVVNVGDYVKVTTTSAKIGVNMVIAILCFRPRQKHFKLQQQ